MLGPSLCTKKKMRVPPPPGVHHLFCAHLINIFFKVYWTEIFYPSVMLRGCLVCVIVFIHSDSNFVCYDCSQIEPVHPIFCAHLIHVLYYFLEC